MLSDEQRRQFKALETKKGTAPDLSMQTRYCLCTDFSDSEVFLCIGGGLLTAIALGVQVGSTAIQGMLRESFSSLTIRWFNVCSSIVVCIFAFMTHDQIQRYMQKGKIRRDECYILAKKFRGEPKLMGVIDMTALLLEIVEPLLDLAAAFARLASH